jgi:hypothetical protein
VRLQGASASDVTNHLTAPQYIIDVVRQHPASSPTPYADILMRSKPLAVA